MRIVPIVTQLAATCPTANYVKVAYGVNAAQRERVPCIYVHPMNELTKPSEYDNFVAQTIEQQFVVLSVADSTGDELQDLRDEIMPSMLGFKIDANHDAIEFVRGELIDTSISQAWWRDIFRTVEYVRQS